MERAQLFWFALFLCITTGETQAAPRKHRVVQANSLDSHRTLKEKGENKTGISSTAMSNKCKLAYWADKLVVVSRGQNEDVSWMATSLISWLPFIVYSSPGGLSHTMDSNKGREAQAYLRFIVDYYLCLPKEVAFIHAHQYSPHSYDALIELKRLKWGSLPGYLSLSRPTRSNMFYLAKPEKHLPPPDDTSVTAHWCRFAYNQSLVIRTAWQQLFASHLGEMPEEMSAPCCGQFAVTSAQIMEHPQSFYEDILKWLRECSYDDFWSGLALEHTWAYIFGAGLNYSHPEDCKYHICSPVGEPEVPSWEILQDLNKGRITLEESDS